MRGKAARAYTVAYSDLDEHRTQDAGYYRLVGKRLKHMGEGDGRERQARISSGGKGDFSVASRRTRRTTRTTRTTWAVLAATMKWQRDYLPPTLLSVPCSMTKAAGSLWLVVADDASLSHRCAGVLGS